MYIFDLIKTKIYFYLPFLCHFLISLRNLLLIPFSKALNCTNAHSVGKIVKIARQAVLAMT